MQNKVVILGINCAYHESSACLVVNGQLIAAVEEERFNRVKHAKPSGVDKAAILPLQAIEFCLQRAGLNKLADVNFVGYSFKPKERLDKNCQYQHGYLPTPGDFGTLAGEELFYQGNLQVEKQCRDMGFTGEFYYLDHHDCHAASAFFVSNYDKAAVLVIDGIGEFESTTFYQGVGINLRKLKSFDYPNSLGFLWEKMTAFLGFSEYDAAKVMGLSSYGQPGVFKPHLEKLLQVAADGSFTVNDALTQFRNRNYEHLETIFGIAKRDKPVDKVDADTQIYADIAVALQIATEEIFCKLAASLRQETGCEYLCIAGGVALNCVANGYLSYEQFFNNFYVQPAANDAGTAIGAAYLIWHDVLKQPRMAVDKTPYLGPDFSDEVVEQALQAFSLHYQRIEQIESTVSDLLVEGKIIAWFQGRMEIGPRALGNRSLLADPRKMEVIELMNRKVKHRELFRPFCPSVLKEKANEWFELPDPIPEVADYMLGAFRAKKDKAHLIPAVVHFDGTSRIQTVRQDTNPRFHRLLSEMELRTGVPVLLNTSFNDQEPIVCTPQDAIRTFMKTKIDYLVMGNYLVTKA